MFIEAAVVSGRRKRERNEGIWKAMARTRMAKAMSEVFLILSCSLAVVAMYVQRRFRDDKRSIYICRQTMQMLLVESKERRACHDQ